MAWQNIRRTGAAAAAVAGLGALLVGCGASNLPNAQLQAFGAAGAPMSIACEPNQRAVVRQVIVNGVPQAQAECQSVAGAVGTAGAYAPVAYTPAAIPVNYGYSQTAIPETRLVQTAYTPPVVTRQAAPQRVVYQPARERVVAPKRSVKKSAVIIGSSAGVGAGVGALIGGKKGAGIGALVGGGGAALWDQITRR
jgi:hypothetical protein